MTINRYMEPLNGLLVRSGHAATSYVSANFYYLARVTVAEAADRIVRGRVNL